MRSASPTRRTHTSPDIPVVLGIIGVTASSLMPQGHVKPPLLTVKATYGRVKRGCETVKLDVISRFEL